jgi:hypothetical protein
MSVHHTRDTAQAYPKTHTHTHTVHKKNMFPATSNPITGFDRP